MYQPFLFFILFSILCTDVNGQKGINSLSLNGEVTTPVFQNDRGFGVFVKDSYGISRSGQLTLSAGVSRFHAKNSTETGEITTRLVAFLFGYRHNIQKFSIEPKIGIGELGGKIKKDGDYSRPSIAAVFSGLGAGIKINRFNPGINFLTVHGIENASAGTWYNKSFHYTSIFLGYDLFSKSKQQHLKK